MITPGLCSSYLVEVLAGVHQPQDEYRIALFTEASSIGPNTTAYGSSAGEVIEAGGYKTGGRTLSGFAISSVSGTAIIDFNDATWTNATITARGAMIYNASKGKRAILVLDFGSNISSTAGSFSVIFPPPTASEALIRIA